ncbi:hypothetical protein GPJ56_002701 [Histomonas meleagridis]|uniref:uncharacterized protein n=1 Tax=Histomonas meleagridis TaxID=135588 RepID=UPI0035595769|nr:hypothetical protein GPJ56_002701 [Histomonas meleagridis]KAH0803009.1 hypothetical protein GO595_004102 [Histomonas meleagridis]
MDLQSPFELDASLKEVLASKRVSIHLFTSKNADCSSFAKYCDRVHLFELGSNDLVAPELYQFLKSDSLFGARVKVLTPNCFEVLQLSSRRNITGPETLLTMLDGQSSIFVDAKMTRPSNSQSLVFQIVVTGIRSDGKKILRVLGFEARSTSNVESFDGVLYGCYLARQCAVDSYYISYEESYREHRERCIQLVSAWSSDGYYKRSILPLFRDVPLFMYSIQISDMYKSSATAIEKVATVLNLMNSTVDIMRRILYPILLLPPLSFPHRLQRSSIGAFKFIVFIRDFDGIAVILDDLNHDEEIQEISDKYEVPITKCSNGEILTNFFIEEQNPTFARFTEKLEVEVNGKRF